MLGLLFVALGCSNVGYSNAAQSALRPLAAAVEAKGGNLIWDNGGAGPFDSEAPWYAAYYSLPDGPDFNYDIVALAQRDGYAMLPPVGNGGPAEGMSITGKRGDEMLDILISRTYVNLECGLEGYGRRQVAGKHKVILYLELHTG